MTVLEQRFMESTMNYMRVISESMRVVAESLKQDKDGDEDQERDSTRNI